MMKPDDEIEMRDESVNEALRMLLKAAKGAQGLQKTS